jgi:hypothetical protein
MSEDCIICGESGGFYINQAPFKTGPYCSQHRWELNAFLLRKRDRMLESKFNEWVDEFQREQRRWMVNENE